MTSFNLILIWLRLFCSRLVLDTTWCKKEEPASGLEQIQMVDGTHPVTLQTHVSLEAGEAVFSLADNTADGQ